MIFFIFLHSTLPLGGGGSNRNIVIGFGVKKTRMLWLSDGEQFEDLMTRFDKIHKRDRRTDGHA